MRVLVSSLAGLVIGLLTVPVAAAEPLAIGFTEACPAGPDSPAVTAVGLRAAAGEPLPPARVLVLVDTSASQTGEFHRRSLEALAGLLEAGRPVDRFAIAAVDVACTPLTEAFSPAGDESLRAASLALDARTPLGSTELLAALDEAIDRLRGDGPAAIVYVGDGPALNGIDPDEFAAVVDRLRAERIPVSSLGIGPSVNWQCLAALAANTGGSVLFPQPTDDAKQSGARIAGQAVQPVIWPQDMAVATDQTDAAVRVLPTRAPPLRADRDSVVLIEGPLAGAQLQLNLGEAAAPRAFSVPIPEVAADEGNAFLAELARNSRASDGLFLPVVGRDGLAVARGVIRDEAARLAALAAQAEATGSHASALRLAEASLRRDPDNPDASVVREVARRQAGPAAPPPPPQPQFTPPPRDELVELDEMRSRRGEEQERDAALRIREARQLLSTDPDLARDRLKQLQEEIRTSEDLGPAARERLVSQLEMRIRESIIRSREKTERDLAAERRSAIGRERQRLTGELQRKEEKIRLLTDKYNALVEEGIRVGYAQAQNYPEVIGDASVGGDEGVTGNEPPTRAFTEAERIAGEEIAREAPPLYANHPIPMTARVVGRTAPLVARILDYDAQNYRTRRDQQRGFMDVLHLVDAAGIPFPDEPPVVYPSAARWREISRLREKYKSVDLANPGSREKKIYDALEQDVENWSFPEGSTLLDLQKAVQQQFPGIPVEFDKKAFDDEGLDPSTLEITQQSSSQVTLRAALRRLLGGLDLTYMVKDEVLLITTQAEAENNLVVKVYPVADLVLPVDPGAGLNPFQSGGGLGGQNSINSGMNMGGGMGGAGGGMGMGGAGLGGFGNCWVAREVYGVHNPRWLAFRQWMGSGAPAWLRDLYAARGEAFAGWLRDKPAFKAVIRAAMDAVLATQGYPLPHAEGGLFQISAARDRIAASSGSGAGSVTPVAATETTTPAASDAERPSRTGLPANVLDAADLHAALRDYLAPVTGGGAATDQRDAADRMARLRASAADLGRDGRFDRAADLISAAITAGHAEPWMYESLAVALEAAGRPRAEVERTLLSAADFAGSSLELLQLAHYMARFGFDQQAIRMCRRVTRGDPANREAYALAMTVAARTEDGGALRWACPGVLAHDWPADQQEVATRAARLARATIESLRASGRAADADAFQADVDRALVRDLVIDLAWTGDADVDIAVQEPTGSVCSLAMPRSPAGGTLLGDGDAGGDGTTHRERYVVSEAFPGEYRVLVKRSWGKVAADTVTAEMTIHRGTDREQTITRQVRLGADDQMLTVTLPDGRRKDPLVEAQLAQDVSAQRALGRAVLAQQLAAISDPATAASMAASREAVVGPAPVPGLPFFGRGAVGYQPIITTLPEGVNLYARTVVSADRRYVRITSVPLFSGVGNVTQFNFAGGGTGAVGVGGAAGGQLGGAGGQLGGAGGQLGGAGGIGAGPAAGAAAGVGAGAGGQVQGICWVARTVYGERDPRWLAFRDWLRCDAPGWLHDLYAARGEGFAAWLRDKPAARRCVRFLMDMAIAGRDLPTAR